MPFLPSLQHSEGVSKAEAGDVSEPAALRVIHQQGGPDHEGAGRQSDDRGAGHQQPRPGSPVRQEQD